MFNSRKIEDLHPAVAAMALNMLLECKKSGIELIITSTFRDRESQEALYAQGRTFPGPIVTNARGGESYHNYRLAFDVVPIKNGKPVWTTLGDGIELWKKVGEAGESVGLDWGGRFKKIKDFSHFQASDGLTIIELQNGAMPKFKF